MFRKHAVSLQPLTPEFVKTFMALATLRGERKLRKSHVAHLEHLIESGFFVSPTWATILDTTTGITYRGNGQHSSKALARYFEEWAQRFPKGLNVTIEEWHTDNIIGDGMKLFQIFDDPRQSRTNLDVMGQYKAQYDDLSTIDEKLIVALTNGMYLFEKGLSKGKGMVLGARERGIYLEDEARRAFVLWAATHMGSRHANFLTKPGITSEMYGEWRNEQAYAESFWHLVLTETHPDADHETRELVRSLLDFINKPQIKQDKFRSEVRKQWKRYVRTQPLPTQVLPFTVTDVPVAEPVPSTDSGATA